MKSILITGATGFVGSHLNCRLTQENLRVKAAVRSPDKPLPQSITSFLIGDISGTTNWDDALQDTDVVIHLAGRAHILDEQAHDPEAEFLKVNTDGTTNLVKQAIQAGVKHFIFISSVKAMADSHTTLLTENTICQPDTPYGRSKLQAEQGLINLAKESDMTWTIIRPPLVYGAGNAGNMERLLKLVNKGVPLPFGSINNRRSFVYVENLVDAITLCINHFQAKNQMFLISDREDLSTPQLIEKIAQHAGQPSYLFPYPLSLLKAMGKFGDLGETLTKRSLPVNSAVVDRLLGSLVVDSSHICQTLNWQPPYTIDAGLSRTLNP
jgi:nucleoside-diphosphate-sugar epimerase